MAISSADEFIRLRNSQYSDEYLRAAHEPASMEVWMDVVERYPEARIWVAQNKTVPLDILALLAKDPDPKVRFMVAMKRKLTPELLEVLARDSDEGVRERVARHRRTPRTLLEQLANDPWEEIRAIVAERLNGEGS
jgi:hypothetical protein